jgi:hypothetical protein
VEVAELGAHLTAASATREELVDKQEKAEECQHEVQDILVKTDAINEKVSRVCSHALCLASVVTWLWCGSGRSCSGPHSSGAEDTTRLARAAA